MTAPGIDPFAGRFLAVERRKRDLEVVLGAEA